MFSLKRSVAILAIATAASSVFADLNILVYNDDTINGFAVTAANEVSSSVTIADSTTFHGLITGGIWDVVLVDATGIEDEAEWSGLIDYVDGGGRAVMTYWQWQSNTGVRNAFGISKAEDFSLTDQTLYAHVSSFFDGVTMPNSEWENAWSIDGAVFTAFDGVSLGGFTETGESVIAHTNQGRTIAWALFDEAGDTWRNDGSAVRLWKNAIAAVGPQPVPEPATMAALGLGALALLRRRNKV